MILVVTLQREVVDKSTALIQIEQLRLLLQQLPDVDLTAQIHEHIDLEPSL